MYWSRIIYSILFIVALGFFFFNVYRLLARLCLGKWENRFDHLGTRVWKMLVFAFGQRRVLRKPYGFNHFLIFWGFLILLVLNSEFLIKGLFPKFSYSFIGDTPYSILLIVTEVMSAVVLVTMVIACVRRVFFRPSYIEATPDAFIIIILIAALMLAYFGFHGAEIRLDQTKWTSYMPGSKLASFVYASMAENTVELIKIVWWWIHALVLLVFLNYLPYSKHLHILTAIPNCFFQSFTIPKTVPCNTFELGNSFGVSKVTQFSWKSLLDFMACTECGRCQDVCPASNTGKALNPRKLIHQAKKNLFTNTNELFKSRGLSTLSQASPNAQMKVPLIGEGEESIAENDLWSCTTCGACMRECPVLIEHVPKFIEMRRHLIMEQAKFPKELFLFFENMEQRSNPWGIAPTDRAKWAEELDVPILKQGNPVDYLFFVGCFGSFDSRTREVTKAIAKIFNAASLSWAILGNEEKCCGDSLRRLGNEYVFEQMARENIRLFEKYGVHKIVTHCPHGYTTFKNDYKQFGGNFEVIHHSELIEQLIREKRLKLKKSINERIIYHDPCYLGRYNNIYEPPRNIIRMATGGKTLLEMDRQRDKSFCCGAGGGRMWLDETEGKKIYLERTQEALRKNPSIIAVACPFCMTMFEDGVKQEDVEDKVHVKDIAEIVAQAMEL